MALTIRATLATRTAIVAIAAAAAATASALAALAVVAVAIARAAFCALTVVRAFRFAVAIVLAPVGRRGAIGRSTIIRGVLLAVVCA